MDEVIQSLEKYFAKAPAVQCSDLITNTFSISREEAAFGQTRTLRSGGGPSLASTHATLKELSAQAPVFTEQTRGEKQHDIGDESELFRASTPIEASSREPDTSRAGHVLRWSQWQEGAGTGELGGPGA